LKLPRPAVISYAGHGSSWILLLSSESEFCALVAFKSLISSIRLPFTYGSSSVLASTIGSLYILSYYTLMSSASSRSSSLTLSLRF